MPVERSGSGRGEGVGRDDSRRSLNNAERMQAVFVREIIVDALIGSSLHAMDVF